MPQIQYRMITKNVSSKFYKLSEKCYNLQKMIETKEWNMTMNIYEMLQELQKKALHDDILRQRILKTEQEKDPLDSFSKICIEMGYEIYPMDIIIAGEESYAAMRRSTNGGGENAPLLEGEDDFYELFLAVLRQV